ncbi:hypothetical protein ABIE27_001268 [Paenibacillus sp. 4624]|jgi:hypothetical protein
MSLLRFLVRIILRNLDQCGAIAICAISDDGEDVYFHGQVQQR